MMKKKKKKEDQSFGPLSLSRARVSTMVGKIKVLENY